MSTGAGGAANEREALALGCPLVWVRGYRCGTVAMRDGDVVLGVGHRNVELLVQRYAKHTTPTSVTSAASNTATSTPTTTTTIAPAPPSRLAVCPHIGRHRRMLQATRHASSVSGGTPSMTAIPAFTEPVW